MYLDILGPGAISEPCVLSWRRFLVFARTHKAHSQRTVAGELGTAEIAALRTQGILDQILDGRL